MKKQTKTVLALDASLSSTGYAIIDYNLKPILINRICTDTRVSEEERIRTIVNDIVGLCVVYNIKEAVIEDQHFSINKKTAMQLSRLRGAITYALMEKNITVSTIAPTTTKKVFCGRGNASKEDVAAEVLNKYPNNTLIRKIGPFSDKSGKNKTSDMYDALCIGYSYIVGNRNEK
ncbi:crossover junction endodeoxyribonuclease RuvC family protein (plasmid) [Clostridium baratii str. Sullivan]|uniref:Crossover junction endodeoxyribonuclease RuvC family protein n=1 Tax=Clostridium baratii str. Sullivan TaxID=1415775 RepID=A0A0A7G2L3_9CLOT|nr:crossover junction endodeoxyribonuclease RuvC [Clostridium baratii]AIY85270.1 crossover junction endodeoxyribonuclease RuvC family protein [Clostridium baratii str. Sullivan]